MSDRYLLDTNHIGAAVRRVSPVRDRIQLAHRHGLRFGTCIPVLCELEVGFQQTARPEEYRKRLSRLLEVVRLWPIEQNIAFEYGKLYLVLKSRGKVLSHVDLLLAALAKMKKLTLLTTDKDFQALPQIPTENWLE